MPGLLACLALRFDASRAVNMRTRADAAAEALRGAFAKLDVGSVCHEQCTESNVPLATCLQQCVNSKALHVTHDLSLDMCHQSSDIDHASSPPIIGKMSPAVHCVQFAFCPASPGAYAARTSLHCTKHLSSTLKKTRVGAILVCSLVQPAATLTGRWHKLQQTLLSFFNFCCLIFLICDFVLITYRLILV